MEDTLRELTMLQTLQTIYVVLILVLMEDTLRENPGDYRAFLLSLNPCFNGRYSQRDI